MSEIILEVFFRLWVSSILFIIILTWIKFTRCMDKYLSQEDYELCPNPACDKGKVIMETESSIIDCEICNGRGYRKRD